MCKQAGIGGSGRGRRSDDDTDLSELEKSLGLGSRIVGGNRATQADWPWIVMIAEKRRAKKHTLFDML